MLIVAQQFSREAVQNAFDEAAEHRGRDWAVDKLHKVVGVRSVDEVPEEKYMHAVAAFCGHMTGIAKPTGPFVHCKGTQSDRKGSSVGDQLNAMADDIYAKQRNA
jgi:hypothetical protein